MTLMPKDKTFSSLIRKMIFHNLSNPINSSMSDTSLMSYSVFSSIFIFSLLISMKVAMNNFNCSIVISPLSFSDINSIISFLNFSLVSAEI